MTATLQKNIKDIASGVPVKLMGVNAAGKGVLGSALPATTTIYHASKLFQLDVAPVSGNPRIQGNGNGNTLTIRNQSSAQYSISSVTFSDSSASNSDEGKEMLAIGHDNGGSNGVFSLINFIESSNDPQNPATQAPTDFRLIQTGYLNSLYSSALRFDMKGDGTLNFYAYDGGSGSGFGEKLMTIPLLFATGITFTSLVNFQPLANAQAIAVSGFSLTGSNTTTSLLNLAGTWNVGANVAQAAILLNVTDTGSAATSLLMSLQVGGSNKFTVRKDGNVLATSNLLLTNNSSGIYLGSSSDASWQRIKADMMGLGGTTSSFPGFKRSSAVMETKLADDSAYAQHSMLQLGLVDGVTAPSATVGLAKIYVDTADGDLKVIFGDGTVKTISVDT